ncbi:MAG: hypothetical protein RXR20_06965 [Paraburkholderia sp.]|uniref:hypothetical protein n=1 Tax=Burkholderiaceae TaxID=119060 RepID=UPI0010F5297F|nr:hypothetical protein [Burkholderia sp. 4M9327F10]
MPRTTLFSCAKSLQPERVNRSGSSVSRGYPIGARGAIIATKAVCELQRINGHSVLLTIRIVGSQGIAAIFERV